MSNLDIIRAWKDEEYRLTLSEAEQLQLPANPAGVVELLDASLRAPVDRQTARTASGLGFCTTSMQCP